MHQTNLTLYGIRREIEEVGSSQLQLAEEQLEFGAWILEFFVFQTSSKMAGH